MNTTNIMKFTRTALKNLVSKPATRPYPEEPRIYPERTRGHIEINIEACVLCGLCSRKCPTGAITVDRAGKSWEIERFGCIQCGCCVEVCPRKCLLMKQSYTDPAPQKHEDKFVKVDEVAPAEKVAAPVPASVLPQSAPVKG